MTGLTGIDKLNRHLLIRTLRQRAARCEEAVTCSAGEQTTTYLDVPGALQDAYALKLATQVLRVHLLYLGLSPTAIGGPTTGAIPLVVGAAMRHHDDDFRWFIVRDKIKEHGLRRQFVGAEPNALDRVVLVDDVASSGKSLFEAYRVVVATGAQVVAVVPLVDRGTNAAPRFADYGVLYSPVLIYRDLDLPPLEG